MMDHTRTANWCYIDGNLWDLQGNYVIFFCQSQIFIDLLKNSLYNRNQNFSNQGEKHE